MELSPNWLKTIFVFILGLEFGSFANVCIFRWPRNSSVIKPRRSFCPWCSRSIAWFDNIPVLSFIMLAGKCRSCSSPISFRYPLIELSTAILWSVAYRVFGPVDSFNQVIFLVGVFLFLMTAIITTMTDIDWRTIPDEATAMLAIGGLVTALANPFLGVTIPERIMGSVLGLSVGAGVVWLVGYVGEQVFAREAMGGGDVKLLGAMGTVIGWDGALATLFLAAGVGAVLSIIGLASGRMKRYQYIPFGPFLNLAGAAVLLTAAPSKIVDILIR